MPLLETETSRAAPALLEPIFAIWLHAPAYALSALDPPRMGTPAPTASRIAAIAISFAAARRSMMMWYSRTKM